MCRLEDLRASYCSISYYFTEKTRHARKNRYFIKNCLKSYSLYNEFTEFEYPVISPAAVSHGKEYS